MAAEVDDIVHELGLIFPADVVARITKTPVTEVRATLLSRGSRLSPEEQELAEEVRSLAKQALAKAQRLLRWGSADQQMTIIKAVLGNASRLIGQDNPGDIDGRVAIQSIFAEMRRVDPSITIVTEEGIIDVDAHAVAEPPHH